ncbi:TolC family protein [Halothermothrix orenii]|uniref:Outer membrane efflux protein n=1 Tax=Halothermothrix orenii (strain H 168 / OCM 544 / DSM 9562) TaxID=373903 RepID=B8D234_HALOH|nr:TolC family protein [Halothermothrix orenii]ACL69261.1 outer membrane efflux protein [Halothermothrix orenii H 168]
MFLNKRYIYFIVILMMFSILVPLDKIYAEEVLTLTEVLQAGLKENPDIKNTRLDLENARLDLSISWRNLLPEVNLQSAYTRLGEPPQVPGFQYQRVETGIPGEYPDSDIVYLYPEMIEGPQDNYTTTITLNQPLFMGGRLLLGIDQARKGVELARSVLEQKKEDTLYQLINTYYNTLLLSDRLQVEEEGLDLIREQKEVIRAGIEAGTILKTDLLQVEIEENKAWQRLQKVKNQYKLALKQLYVMSGLDKSVLKEQEVILKKPQFKPEVNINDLSSLIKLAKENRPDLKMLSINEEMIKNNITMEKRSNWPSFMVSGNYSWQGEELKFEDPEWTVTISGSLPLFQGGKSGKRLKKINNEFDKIREKKQYVSEMVEVEVTNVFNKINELEENVVIQDQNLNKAQENLRLVNSRYKVGMVTNLDVMNARLLYRQSKLGLLQAEFNYKLAMYELLYKTGRLGEFVEEVVNNETK